MVCRGVAWSETCLDNGLVVVKCGLWSFEEKLAEEFVQDGDGSNRWVGSSMARAGSPALIITLIVVSLQFGGVLLVEV